MEYIKFKEYVFYNIKQDKIYVARRSIIFWFYDYNVDYFECDADEDIHVGEL